MTAGRKRTSGAIRRLPSGRWQARLSTASGERITLGTFATKADADAALADASHDARRGAFVAPTRGRVTLAEHAEVWLAAHRGTPRTLQTARSILRVHVLPELGAVRLSDLDPGDVDVWFARVRTRTGVATAAHAYRVLHAVLADAVRRELLVRSPARIEGAGKDPTPTNHAVTLPQVLALAAAVPVRYAAMVLLAAFGALRSGELFGLARGDVDLLHNRVHVRRQHQRLVRGGALRRRAQVRQRPHRAPAVRGCRAPRRTPGRVRRPRPRRPGVTTLAGTPLDVQRWNHRWRAAKDTVAAADPTFDPAPAVPRAARLRRHAGGRAGRNAGRAHAPPGALQPPRSSALPARHRRPRRGPRRPAGAGDHRGPRARRRSR